jgi:hypothetical protein
MRCCGHGGVGVCVVCSGYGLTTTRRNTQQQRATTRVGYGIASQQHYYHTMVLLYCCVGASFPTTTIKPPVLPLTPRRLIIESNPTSIPPHTHVPCKYRTPTAAFEDALTSFIGYWTGLRLGAPSFCFCFDCCFWLAVRRGAHPFHSPARPPFSCV